MTPLTPALYNIIRYNIITIYLTITWHYNVITQNLGTAFLSPTPTKMITLHVHQHIFKTLRLDFRRWCSEELQLGAVRLHVPKAEEPPLRAQVWGSKLAAPSCIQLPPPTWRGVCFPPYKCAENNKISPWSPFHYSQHDPHFRRTYLIISF